MNINEQLVEYGLLEKEAKIYTYLVKNIEATAYSIAKDTKIPRATAYLALDTLKSKGLVSITHRNNVSHFICESPNRLKKIAEEKLSLADLLIPQLRNLTTIDQFSPNTKLYVGEKGVKNVFDDILETLKENKIKQLYSISNSSIIKTLPKYFPEWVKQREKLGVFTKMLGEKSETPFAFPSNTMRETRFFPSSIVLDCSINIYGNKISCFSIKDKEIYSVVIESPTVAHTIRQLFLLVWDSLEKSSV